MLLRVARKQGYSDDEQLEKAIQQIIIFACQRQQQPLCGGMKDINSELCKMMQHAREESKSQLIMYALQAIKVIATEINSETSGELIIQVCNAVCKFAQINNVDDSKASADVVALIKTPIGRSGKALKMAFTTLDFMRNYYAEDAELCNIIINALRTENDLVTLKMACSVAKTLADTNAANKQALIGAGEAAIKLLNSTKCNTSLAKHLCNLINSLITENVSNQEIIGNVPNCCATLVSIIRTHNNEKDIDVAIMACALVDCLARNHARNCEQLGKAGACDAVMAIFKSLPSSDKNGAKKAMAVLSAICKLSQSCANNLLYFRQAHCDELVLKWMNQFGISDQKLAHYAFRAISLLCEHDAPVKQRIGESDACSTIVDILKQPTATTALIEFGFAALRNLCDDNVENLWAVSQLDICKLIAGALKQSAPEKNPLLAQYACWMVHQLSANDDYERELAQNDVCSELVRLLGVCNEDDVKVAKYATAALAKFATICSEAKWYNAHACTLLETLTKRFSNNADVIENICRTIGNLCICLDRDDWLLNVGAYELVIRALENHYDSTSVAKEACRALEKLLNKSNNTLIPLQEHCELVVAALWNSPNDAKLVKFACRAVQCLARKNLADLTDLGACETVQKVLHLEQMDKPTAISWCDAVWELARDKSNQVKLGEAICRNIILLLKKFQQLGRNACEAISKLAAAPSKHQWLRDACKQVCLMLQVATTTVDKNLVQAACSAIAELAKNDTGNQASLQNYGACALVVKAMILFIDDKGVMQEGCFALWTLAEEFANDERKQACGLVAYVLRAFPMLDTSRLTTYAVHAVSLFATKNQREFGRLGVCALVVQALKDCGKNNAEVSRFACLAIYELASLESNRELLNIENAAGVVRLLISWHAEHRIEGNEAKNAILRLQGQPEDLQETKSIDIARKRHKTG